MVGRRAQAEGNQGRSVLRAGSQLLLQYLDVKGAQGLRQHQACPQGAHRLTGHGHCDELATPNEGEAQGGCRCRDVGTRAKGRESGIEG